MLIAIAVGSGEDLFQDCLSETDMQARSAGPYNLKFAKDYGPQALRKLGRNGEKLEEFPKWCAGKNT